MESCLTYVKQIPKRLQSIRKVKSIRIAVALLMSTTVLAACSSSTASKAPATTKTKALIPFTLITFPVNYYFTDVVAQSEGFFRQEGLKVAFIKPASGTSALQLLLSGSVDGLINGGALSILPVATEHEDLKIVGSTYNKNAWTLYGANSDKALTGTSAGFPKAIHELAGATVGVTSIGAESDLQLQLILKAAGMNPSSSVHPVGIGLTQAALGQFQAGRIDAYIGASPAGSVFKGVAHRQFVFATQASSTIANVAEGTLLTSGTFLSAHPATVKRWIAAEYLAMKWIENKANLNTAASLFASSYGGTKAAAVVTVKFLDSTVYPHTLPNLVVPRSAFNNDVKLLINTGLMKANQAHYSSIVASFAQQK